MEERIAALEKANRQIGWVFGGLVLFVIAMNILQTRGLRSIDCDSLTVHGGGIWVLGDDRQPVARLGSDGGNGELSLFGPSRFLARLGVDFDGGTSLELSGVTGGAPVVRLGTSPRTGNGELELSGSKLGPQVRLGSDAEVGPFVEYKGDEYELRKVPLAPSGAP